VSSWLPSWRLINYIISRSRKRSNDFSRSAKKRLKVATTKPLVKY
jgi:hypothetical protein